MSDTQNNLQEFINNSLDVIGSLYEDLANLENNSSDPALIETIYNKIKNFNVASIAEQQSNISNLANVTEKCLNEIISGNLSINPSNIELIRTSCDKFIELLRALENSGSDKNIDTGKVTEEITATVVTNDLISPTNNDPLADDTETTEANSLSAGLDDLGDKTPPTASSGAPQETKTIETLVLFDSGNQCVYGVPTKEVVYIKNINAQDVEYSGEQAVFQFDDQAVPMTDPVNNLDLKSNWDCNRNFYTTIIVKNGPHFVGFMVNKVLNIFEPTKSITTNAIDRQGVFGNTICDNQIVTIVDVPYLVNNQPVKIKCSKHHPNFKNPSATTTTQDWNQTPLQARTHYFNTLILKANPNSVTQKRVIEEASSLYHTIQTWHAQLNQENQGEIENILLPFNGKVKKAA